MADTLTYTGKLTITVCWCGMHMALPADLYAYAQRTGKPVWCPLGHEWVVRETEVDRLKAELVAKEARLQRVAEDRDWYSRQMDHARRDAQHQAAVARGYKGQLVRTKKRIGAGTCPCCNRTFQQLARHMKSQHPEYAASPAD